MFVNDWLHEWDLGEAKALIEHLIRILYACKGGADLIDELNERCVRYCSGCVVTELFR